MISAYHRHSSGHQYVIVHAHHITLNTSITSLPTHHHIPGAAF
jgi:hypothetical protein